MNNYEEVIVIISINLLFETFDQLSLRNQVSAIHHVLKPYPNLVREDKAVVPSLPEGQSYRPAVERCSRLALP